MSQEKTLQQKYDELKKWLYWEKGIQIPISIEPYTREEYERRERLTADFGQLYWEDRDHQAALAEKMGNAPWLKEETNDFS